MQRFLLIFTFLFIGTSFLAQNTKADEPPLFGSYFGYVEHAKLKRSQEARLDFVLESAAPGQPLKLKALLKFAFGGWDSGEYITYHFDKVEYNLLTGSIVFDQADQEISLVADEFAGGVLRGRLRSNFGGEVGRIVLRQNGASINQMPRIEGVEGDYASTCDGTERLLKLRTYRSTEDTFQIGNPFGAYQIRGELAETPSEACLQPDSEAPAKPCVTFGVLNATYNFFEGRLSLFGATKNMECRVEGTALACGSCRYERRPAPQASNPNTPRARRLNVFPTLPASSSENVSTEALSGEYRGFLHHESLDRYQNVRLNLQAYRSNDASGESKLMISATANLFFGAQDSHEALAYRFDPAEYPNPLLPARFVLSRPEGDVDAMLRVTSIGGGVIRGEWYSLLFGRVGTFELRKKGLPALARGASIIGPLEGRYRNGAIEVNLGVGLGRTPINSYNPFYPLKLQGSAWIQGHTAREDITGGSYDFYTGRITVTYGENRLLSGFKSPAPSLLLRRLAAGPGTITQSSEWVSFDQLAPQP